MHGSQLLVNTEWWASDGASTQPAVISKGAHLLINAMCSQNSSPSRFPAKARWDLVLLSFPVFAVAVFSRWVIALKRGREKTADSLWSGLAVLFVSARSCFHSDGQCIAPVRRLWSVAVEEGALLCYTLKDHLVYYCGVSGNMMAHRDKDTSALFGCLIRFERGTHADISQGFLLQQHLGLLEPKNMWDVKA